MRPNDLFRLIPAEVAAFIIEVACVIGTIWAFAYAVFLLGVK